MELAAQPLTPRAPERLGVTLHPDGAEFSVWSRNGDTIWVCLFDAGGEREIARWRLAGRDGDIHHGFIPGLTAGQGYGLRCDGPWQPERGHRFDPGKLLVDPYTTRLDRPFVQRPELAAPRGAGPDTAPWVPRAVIEQYPHGHEFATAPIGGRDGRPRDFIYEVNVRAFTARHPDVPLEWRGTLRGLSHPRAIEYFIKLGVSHVELMPIAAWIDERHLPPLGLSNAWGYNPVVFMALDPRLAAGGISDLRQFGDALHKAGIGLILDIVFNHTGESDNLGATLSLRGLDNAEYYTPLTDNPGLPANVTGCGNTLACDRPHVVRLALDALHHFALGAGVDGFRFDLAVTLGRVNGAFEQNAPLFAAIENDPVLASRLLIAEPWDAGDSGYRLGGFGKCWREWNGAFRDDVRRFWRAEHGTIGAIATRIAGSSDLFQHSGRGPRASINFLAAHDGFTLRDLVSYTAKHNWANGEANRDGHEPNFSWNCGCEGETSDTSMAEARLRDIRALLATLFLSRGAPLLAAGDEFGRTQGGNNNAYAQDNVTTHLDWDSGWSELTEYVAGLARIRAHIEMSGYERFLTGGSCGDGGEPDAQWLRLNGLPFESGDWNDAGFLALLLTGAGQTRQDVRYLLIFNRSSEPETFVAPPARPGFDWTIWADSSVGAASLDSKRGFSQVIPARSVLLLAEAKPGILP